VAAARDRTDGSIDLLPNPITSMAPGGGLFCDQRNQVERCLSVPTSNTKLSILRCGGRPTSHCGSESVRGHPRRCHQTLASYPTRAMIRSNPGICLAAVRTPISGSQPCRLQARGQALSPILLRFPLPNFSSLPPLARGPYGPFPLAHSAPSYASSGGLLGFGTSTPSGGLLGLGPSEPSGGLLGFGASEPSGGLLSFTPEQRASAGIAPSLSEYGITPDNPNGATSADVAKSFGIGLAKGGIGVLGLPADAREWAAHGVQRAADYFAPGSLPEVGAAFSAGASHVLPWMAGPTSSEIQNKIERLTGPFYQPKTIAGDYAQTVGEFVPGLAMPGGVARNAVRYVALPALASETAGQLTKGTAAEPWARNIAAALTGLAGARRQVPSPRTPSNTTGALPGHGPSTLEPPVTTGEGQATGYRGEAAPSGRSLFGWSSDDLIRPSITKPYSRPANATTQGQRADVQGRPCATCSTLATRMNANHIEPLVEEYYRTGAIDMEKMRSLDAVNTHCPTCSARQGAYLSAFSKRMKQLYGLK
jgi:hypothetical protein